MSMTPGRGLWNSIRLKLGLVHRFVHLGNSIRQFLVFGIRVGILLLLWLGVSIGWDGCGDFGWFEVYWGLQGVLKTTMGRTLETEI